ncbi:uncharacterized protein LOC115990842 [Quercus lobata]|uniref:uncharacterized protein LOC115990842 n=1 Tax=Quercus lobata TaxID=97700 RepID=UPI00124566FB|nr:uncharacterized protein LOC115990842 [Quercus lobata]
MISDRTGWTAKHFVNATLGKFEHCLVSLILFGAVFWHPIFPLPIFRAFFSLPTTFLCACLPSVLFLLRTQNGKVFVQDLRVVHAKDLNFVLRSEIYVHWDGQLRASHLILGVEPVYSTWQPFKQALIVDSPLLSYIDVRYVNFLPPSLTTGEAREFGRRVTRADELAPLRDESAEKASRRIRELAHEAVQQGQAQEQPIPENPAAVNQQQVIEAAALLARAARPKGKMVSRKVLSVERFVPGARQSNQPPPPEGRGQVPQPSPPPQAGRARKKQKVTDQPSTCPGEVAAQTPPRPTGGIVIHPSGRQTIAVNRLHSDVG